MYAGGGGRRTRAQKPAGALFSACPVRAGQTPKEKIKFEDGGKNNFTAHLFSIRLYAERKNIYTGKVWGGKKVILFTRLWGCVFGYSLVWRFVSGAAGKQLFPRGGAEGPRGGRSMSGIWTCVSITEVKEGLGVGSGLGKGEGGKQNNSSSKKGCTLVGPPNLWGGNPIVRRWATVLQQ